ncbi:hypothetical protein [Roseococcus sp. YIM B11640]|uniref:hypothetical protein n=1 Tax=Roseococcus sp. YIM B11640 TaxID=3133973 RepID=UPI003C7AF60B
MSMIRASGLAAVLAGLAAPVMAQDCSSRATLTRYIVTPGSAGYVYDVLVEGHVTGGRTLTVTMSASGFPPGVTLRPNANISFPRTATLRWTFGTGTLATLNNVLLTNSDAPATGPVVRISNCVVRGGAVTQ